MELAVDRVQVRPESAHADAELVGDFLIAKIVREQREDLVFARGGRLHLGCRGARGMPYPKFCVLLEAREAAPEAAPDSPRAMIDST